MRFLGDGFIHGAHLSCIVGGFLQALCSVKAAGQETWGEQNNQTLESAVNTEGCSGNGWTPALVHGAWLSCLTGFLSFGGPCSVGGRVSCGAGVLGRVRLSHRGCNLITEDLHMKSSRETVFVYQGGDLILHEICHLLCQVANKYSD